MVNFASAVRFNYQELITLDALSDKEDAICKMCKYLEKCADALSSHVFGESALHRAVCEERVTVIVALQMCGADWNVVNYEQKTPAQLLSVNERLQLALCNFFQPKKEHSYQLNLEVVFDTQSDEQILEYLQQTPRDELIRRRGADGGSIFTLAATTGHLELVSNFLIDSYCYS